MDWISKHIAIGNVADVASVVPGQVDAILCLKESCCDEADERFYVSCVPLRDGAGNHPRLVEQAIDFIDSAVSSDIKILVHCHAGRSRSVCVVARYFMVNLHLSPNHAIAHIERFRDVALSPGISDILNA